MTTEIHGIGEMLIVTTKATLSGDVGSTSFRGTFAYTRVWRESDSNW